MVSPQELQESHNQGQTDASNGVNSPPYSSIGDQILDALTLGIGTPSREDQDKLREAYQQGHENTDTQIEESNSCCYIVGACLDDLGLPRNSLEMKAMKQLTKNHILKSFSGKRDYVRYGKIGPSIVTAIRARTNSKGIWEKVHQTLQGIAPQIYEGKYQEGYQQYKGLVLELESQFLNGGNLDDRLSQ